MNSKNGYAVFKPQNTSYYVVRYRLPGGKIRQKTTKRKKKRDAEREAGRIVAAAQKKGISTEISWEEFRKRYEGEELLRHRGTTRQKTRTVLDCYRARYFRSFCQIESGQLNLRDPSLPNTTPKTGREGRKDRASRSCS